MCLLSQQFTTWRSGYHLATDLVLKKINHLIRIMIHVHALYLPNAERILCQPLYLLCAKRINLQALCPSARRGNRPSGSQQQTSEQILARFAAMEERAINEGVNQDMLAQSGKR